MIEVPKPSEISNVFAMDEPHHMLAKLMWELECLMKSTSVWIDNGPYPVPIFAAFNTAVTAWHISDWLWQSKLQTRAQLAKRYQFEFDEWKPKQVRAGLKKLQDAISSESRALHICREIANGSKHMRTDKVDADVKAIAKWDTVIQGAGLVKPGDKIISLTIVDGEQTWDAARLFIEAFGFWERLFTAEKFVAAKGRLPNKILRGKDGSVT